MKSLCAGLISLALTLAFVSQAQSGGATGPIWPFQDNIPDTLMNTFGEYQNIQGSKRIHSAIDIHRDSLKVMVVADAESCWWRRKFNLSGDSAYYSIITGEQEHGNCYGWGYTHVDIGYTFDSLKLKVGDKLQQRANLSRIFRTFDHLHFSRIYGFSNTMPPWPPGEPDTFKIIKAVRNPLDDLPAEQDTFKPWFYGRVNGNWPMFLQRDSSEQSPGDTFKIKSNINGDSTKRYVVNKKVDVVPWVKDRTRSDLYSVGIDRIYYSIRGVNGITQGLKGFSFRLNMPSSFQLEDTSLSKEVQQRVYADTSQSLVGMPQRYIVSNTDSLTSNFDVLGYLVGYWNSKQHKDRAWDGNPAESLKVARFPDNYYWVKATAMDHAGNTAYDSIKCIVNNFPPQIKKTYPDSGGVNFVSGDSIRIWFDQPMSTASAESAFHLQLKGTSSDIAGTKHFVGETLLVFLPQDTLLLDTVYVVKIDATARDIPDSTLLNPYEFPFSTQRTVMLCGVRESPDYNSLQQFDSLASYPPLQTYDSYNGIGPVAAQMLCYDRDGNNYVIHWASDIGSNYVGKFSYTGESLGQYLQGRKYRSITTDGNSLFLLQRSPTDTTRYQYMLKTSLVGDSESCFFMNNANRWTANSVWYNPWDSLLYVAWSDTLPRDTCWVRKYQRNGTPEGGDLWVKPYNGKFKFVMSNDRLALLATYGGGATPCWVAVHPLSNWNYPTYLNLNNYAPYGATSSLVYGAAASPVHFYLAVRSDFSPGYSWIARFDRNGQFAGSILPPDAFYGAMAVFPPAIRFPRAAYVPPDNGDDGGGAQSAELNSLLPRVYALGRCYPNPAKAGLRIDYALPKESRVSLRVFNVMGQLVRTLRDGKEKPGFYKAEWDGKDHLGKRVASGVYLYRMEASEFRKTRKLVVLH